MQVWSSGEHVSSNQHVCIDCRCGNLSLNEFGGMQRMKEGDLIIYCFVSSI